MRFTIRDLLWLIAVAALSAGLWVSRTNEQRAAAKAADTEEALQGWLKAYERESSGWLRDGAERLEQIEKLRKRVRELEKQLASQF